MHSTLRPLLLAAACMAVTAIARAGTDMNDGVTPAAAPQQDNSVPISQEFIIEGGWSGRATTRQGNAKIGGVSDANGHVNYVVSPTIKDGLLLRFGIDAERFSFSLPPGAPLPNTLQSVNAIIGTDVSIGDKTIVRAEIHPGIYSDFVHLTGNGFDCPLQVGGTYLYSKDFQVIFGVQMDLKSNLPVIGLPASAGNSPTTGRSRPSRRSRVSSISSTSSSPSTSAPTSSAAPTSSTAHSASTTATAPRRTTTSSTTTSSTTPKSASVPASSGSSRRT